MQLDYVAIGRRIKTARAAAGMTQEALAERASLSATHMSNIETGHSKLSLPALVALANALGVSADRLLCDNIERSKEVYSQEIQETVRDCSAREIRIIADIVLAAKSSLRRNSGASE